MDLKYLLCEPVVSKIAVKANEQANLIQEQQHHQQQQYGFLVDLHANSTIYPSSKLVVNQAQQHQQEWDINISSPKSICSSISTCSSVSTNSSGDEYNNAPTTATRSHSFSLLRIISSPRQQQPQRRRTASDVSLARHHMFIYSHPNRRPRYDSAGNNNNVQTRTPWTPFEDHLLQEGYDQGLSWAMISSTYLPQRSRGCCWGRFKTLQNKNMIDPAHSQMRHFRRPWKAIDFNNNNNNEKKLLL